MIIMLLAAVLLYHTWITTCIQQDLEDIKRRVLKVQK